MIKRIVLLFSILALLLGTYFYISKNKSFNDEREKFTLWTIQLKPIYEAQMYKIIAEFENNHPNYRVVWVDIPIQEAQKRTLASVLSDNPPDLINLNPDFSQILAVRDVLEYFSTDDINQLNKNLVNQLTYKGKIYALPFYATSPVTIYNKEIFDKCNVEVPKTYNELYKISKKLYACSKTPTFVASLNENDTLYKILNKYNIYNFNQKEEDNAFLVYSMFDEMYKNEYLPKDILTINHREAIEKYMSNSALLTTAGSNFIKMVKQNAPDIYKKSALSAQLVGENKKYDISLMNLVIPKYSKNKELAREFAYLLTNKENQLELSKLTNVLPANKYALEDDYFKSCPSDLVEASRCESVKQMNNLINKTNISDKKTLNENINKTLEEILLNENSCPETTRARIHNLFSHLNSIIFKN